MNLARMEESDSIIGSVSLENASVSQCVVPPPHDFDFSKPELWPLWQLRFKRYLTAADLFTKNESEKVDTLCHVMGEKSKTVLAQVMPDTEGKTLTEVLQAFTDYFYPKKNVMLERYRFNTRIQEPDESVDQFVTALHTLAESCQFGIMKDVLIRDRIVVGLWDTKTSEELQRKSYLTLEEAVTIARQARANREPKFPDKNKVLCLKVGRILDWLSARNFDASVRQFRALRFGSVEQLQGVVDRFYDKVIAEPSRMSLYGRLCNQIGDMKVIDPNVEEDKEKTTITFKKLIVSRCQTEFETNFQNVGACADPIKKKEVQLACIGFIGELFKQNLLIVKIMHWCIHQLLLHVSEVNLECLSKLLKTTGENMEFKGQNLDLYFKQMLDIISGRIPNAISPAVRFMLQDVIELKMNKWIPLEMKSNPEIVDLTLKKPLTSIQPVNTPTNPLEPSGGGPSRKRRRHERKSAKTPPPQMGNTNVPHQPVSNLSANSTITVRPFPPIIIGPLTLPNTLRNERSETNGNHLNTQAETRECIMLPTLY